MTFVEELISVRTPCSLQVGVIVLWMGHRASFWAMMEGWPTSVFRIKICSFAFADLWIVPGADGGTVRVTVS